MSALSTKLRRDIMRMWPQLLAAALVMGCGTGALVMSLSALSSLESARRTYYERYRFPHVFAHAKRVPNAVAARIAEIPGVSRVQTRIVTDVNLDVIDMAEPAIGRIVSIPDHLPFGLSELHLRRGRFPDPFRESEALVSEAFAEAHGLQPGSTVRAIINGRLKELTIVGLALSPEYVYQVRPGDLLPDERHFGIFWMPYRQVAPAFGLDGAFNDVALALAPDASQSAVLAELDRLTAGYGGQGAHGRDEQTSDRFVTNELRQLRAMALVPPSIFLTATAFILNIVFSRLVRTQREQIAALKAFGYSRFAVGRHYLTMALVVAAVGSLLGVALGWSLGQFIAVAYARFFRFPVFEFVLDRWSISLAIVFAAGAACTGAIAAVQAAARLPPAEAMRPEAPADYRATLLERLRLQRFFAPASRMVIRHLERQPVRALLSVFGMSLALTVLVVGSFVHGALSHLMDFLFFTTQRQDITVAFVEPRSARSLTELARLPGVLAVEPLRSVPIRIRFGPRSRLQGIVGTADQATLDRLVDENDVLVPMPKEGLVLGNILAEELAVNVGDRVTIEVLEGQRPIVELPVSAIARTYAGEIARMDIRALNRLMQEGDLASGAAIDIDESQARAVDAALKGLPNVAAVSVKRAGIESFERTIAENILRMRFINVIFASVIAFGVVYNSARVALAERAHELATLRVLGFTRGEASAVLLGELAVLVVAATPIGLVMGRVMAEVVVKALEGNLVRIPFVIEPSTYLFAVTVVAVAALISGLVVRRGIDHLDLVEVLKTKG